MYRLQVKCLTASIDQEENKGVMKNITNLYSAKNIWGSYLTSRMNGKRDLKSRQGGKAEKRIKEIFRDIDDYCEQA